MTNKRSLEDNAYLRGLCGMGSLVFLAGVVAYLTAVNTRPATEGSSAWQLFGLVACGCGFILLTAWAVAGAICWQISGGGDAPAAGTEAGEGP